MKQQAYYANDSYNLVQLPSISSPSKPHPYPHRSQPRQHRPIVVNLGDTQYPVVQEVCEQLGWKVEYSDTRSWDVKWTDTAIASDFVNKMSPHQKVNHFPGMNILSRKNNLTKCIQRLQENFPQQYSFYPRTFLLPFDKHKLKAYTQELKKQGIKKTFIVKPEAGSQGRGIFLTQNVNQIEQCSHCVVQKYVTNPLLYKNLKFDLRVYVLVAGCDPLRIYIYNEGLTRFATEKYSTPNENNFDNLYMHLTNYAINKDHPNYIYNSSVDNLSYGHKKSLAQFFQTLKNMGLKAHQYWSDIKDIIIKTMISGQPHLQHEYRISQPHNLPNNMCFQVLGFDFMIDSNDKVHLLQINHTPSFTTDTPLDQLVKNNLIRDTLTVMNITPKSRDKTLAQIKQQNQRRVFTGKSKKYTPDERQKLVEEIQKERDQGEKGRLGSFQRIYPCKNQGRQGVYEEMLNFSMESYKEGLNGMGGRMKRSPSKFRVKKLVTSQTIDESDHSPNTRNSTLINKPKLPPASTIIRNQTTSLHRNVSTAVKMVSRDYSQPRKDVVLNPEKQLKLQNISLRQPVRRVVNPMVVGSIVSIGKCEDDGEDGSGDNEGNQADKSQIHSQTNALTTVQQQSPPFSTNHPPVTNHRLNNQSLKQIRDHYQRQRLTKGTFLKTRQQESTMFSKMMQRTRE